MKQRLSEIDALRGLAVLLMLLYHFLFDAVFLEVWMINLKWWPWEFLGDFVRILFLGLVGVSVVLSSRNFWGQLKRGVKIFLMGMVLTLATWVIIPELMVKWGILHLIGFSVPLLRLFKGRPLEAGAMALLIGVLSIPLQGETIENPWFLWLGLPYPGFMSVDYFPVIPWLAVPFVGLALGHWIYGDRKPTKMESLAKVPGLTWMGRHALAIYMLHPPVFVGILYLIKYF